MQPNNGAAKIDAQPVRAVTIQIQWMPELGQFKIMWPEVDDVVKLGMIEFAKTLLIEQRAKLAAGQSAGSILIPGGKLAS